MTIPRVAGAIAVALAVAAPAVAREPTLATVLQRAAAYVATVEAAVSGIVAEERYSQQWSALPRGWPLTEDRRRRELASDLLIVKLETAGAWLQFRDVFEVDGAPVRDRDERLMKLLLEPTGSPADQIEGILNESARYNIGNIERNVNTPLLSLLFLDARHQTRFRFFRTKDRTPALSRDASAFPPDVWIVRFEEGREHTVIRTGANRDLPAHGRFWIDPATGRVLMTELVAEDRVVRATVDVSFRADSSDGILLPRTMRERYEGRTNKSVIEGSATYDKFRQFTVNVDEKFLIKK